MSNNFENIRKLISANNKFNGTLIQNYNYGAKGILKPNRKQSEEVNLENCNNSNQQVLGKEKSTESDKQKQIAENPDEQRILIEMKKDFKTQLQRIEELNIEKASLERENKILQEKVKILDSETGKQKKKHVEEITVLQNKIYKIEDKHRAEIDFLGDQFLATVTMLEQQIDGLQGHNQYLKDELALQVRKNAQLELQIQEERIAFQQYIEELTANFAQRLKLAQFARENIDSCIVFSPEQLNTVQQYVEQSIGSNKLRYRCIYRASVHGFGAMEFHFLCNSAPNTVIIIQTTNGSIFGGVSSKSLGSIQNGALGLIADHKACIFSLFCATDPNREPRRCPCIRPEKAIICEQFSGPTFGSDICIDNNSNADATSHTDVNDSYDAGVESNTEAAQNYLCGSHYFKVAEIEVFTVE